MEDKSYFKSDSPKYGNNPGPIFGGRFSVDDAVVKVIWSPNDRVE
jgi:hypothetical protein